MTRLQLPTPLAALALTLALPALAQAHFVWTVAEAEGHTEVHFSEGPYDLTGARLRGLLESIELRRGETPLELRATARGRVGRSSEPGPVQSSYTYGLFRMRGERTFFLLRYYAKGCRTLAEAAEPCGLRTEILTRREGEELVASVRFQGEPVPGAEVVVYPPSRLAPQTLEADAAGEVRIPLPREGLLGIRSHASEPRAGTHEGEDYVAVKHYTTLTLSLDPKGSIPAAADPTAWRALQRAAIARASLPGAARVVSATLTSSQGGQERRGSFRYAIGEGLVEFSLPGASEAEQTWARQSVVSMITHRLRGKPFREGEGKRAVTFSKHQDPRGLSVEVGASTRYVLGEGRFLALRRGGEGPAFSMQVLASELHEQRARATRYVVTQRAGARIERVDSYEDVYPEGQHLPRERRQVTQDAQGERARVLRLYPVDIEPLD